MQGKQSHLTMLDDQLSDNVAAYFKEQTSETLKAIAGVQRSASLFAKPGAILRVRLENFLTHRDKTIDFQRPVTLIHGQNGSGKSSVLQAIHFLICGSIRKIRDNITSVNELKTQLLVKDQEAAVAAPMMRVTGWFWTGSKVVAVARQHEQITVYKLNDYEQRDRFRLIRPVEAELLFRDLGHFPNNSATMITQTAMKSLAKMSPARRYEVFQEASLLDQIEQNSYDTVLNLKELADQSAQGRKLQEELSIKIKEVQKCLNDNRIFIEMVSQAASFQIEIMGYNAQELRLQHLEHEESISQFKEKQMAPVEAEIAQLRQHIDDCQNGAREQQQNLELMQERLQMQEQVVENVGSDVAKQQVVSTRAQVDYTQVEAELTAAQNAASSTREQLLKATKKVELMEVVPFILEEPQVPPQISELNKEIGKSEACMSETNRQIAEQRAERENLQRNLDEFERTFQQFNQQMDQRFNQLRELRNELMNASGNNNVKQQIVRSLAREDQQYNQQISAAFPNAFLLSAGVYLTSSAEQYRGVVRRFISPQDLAQFVLFGTGEAQLLRALNNNYKVITVKQTFNGKQLPRTIAGVECVPLMDILQFENDYVKTALLMLKHIDNVVIIRSISDAEQILQHNSGLIVLPMDAECFVQANNGATISKPARERGFKDQLGGSVVYVQVRDDIRGIEERIKSTELQIKDLQAKSYLFNNYEAQCAEKGRAIQLQTQEEEKVLMTLKRQNNDQEALKKQKFKIQQQYQHDLDNYSRKKREHDDYILEKQTLEHNILLYQKRLLKLDSDLPTIKEKQGQVQRQVKAELTTLAALKKICDEKVAQYNSIRAEIQAQREFMEQNFDEAMLQQKMQVQLDKLSDFSAQLQEMTTKLNERWQLFEEQAKETYTAASRLTTQTKRLKQFLEKSTDQQSFVNLLTGIDPGQKRKDLRQYVVAERNKLYDALALLQTKIQAHQNDFDFDFDAENSKLSDLMAEFDDIKQQLVSVSEQTRQIINSVLCQQIKLYTLRKRAEKETVAIFSKQSQQLQIDLSLSFKFSQLISLGDYFGRWLDYVDQDIYQQYMSIFSEDLTGTQGSIQIASQRRDISSLSGGEQTFVALSFIMSLCKVIQTSYLQIDEWDVFMDAKRRAVGFQNMVRILGASLIQSVLVTPNDVDMKDLEQELQAIIGVVRMDGVERGD